MSIELHIREGNSLAPQQRSTNRNIVSVRRGAGDVSPASFVCWERCVDRSTMVGKSSVILRNARRRNIRRKQTRRGLRARASKNPAPLKLLAGHNLQKHTQTLTAVPEGTPFGTGYGMAFGMGMNAAIEASLLSHTTIRTLHRNGFRAPSETRLNVSAGCVYQLIDSGKLAHHRIGVGRGAIRIDQQDVQSFLDDTRNEKRDETTTRRPPRHRLKHVHV